jgi:hypothetical protein
MKRFLIILILTSTPIAFARDFFTAYFEKDGMLKFNLPVETASAIEREPMDANPSAWGERDGDLVLSLQFSKQRYSIAERIEAAVLLRNLSGSNLVIAGSAPETDFRFVATDGERRPVPVSDFAKTKWEGIQFLGARPVELPPFSQAKFVINVGQFFQIQEAGDYVFTASRRLAKGVGRGFQTLRSQNVLIKIDRVPSGELNPDALPTAQLEKGNVSRGVHRAEKASDEKSRSAVALTQQQPVSTSSQRETALGSSPNVSVFESTPLANTAPRRELHHFTSAQKISLGMLAALSALLLAILWRASRRKPGT